MLKCHDIPAPVFDPCLVDVPKYILNCPLVMDWCVYKGEIMFAALNYERSIESRRVMLDLSVCATRALNGTVVQTVAFIKSKFTPWPGHSYWKYDDK